MSASAARRVWAIVYRHLALYRRSWPRVFELMYWPSLQMLVWGFVSAWLASLGPGAGPFAAGVLLGGVLLWEVALRSQMGFAISFLEEIWSRNLGHVFVSPIRPEELVAALIAMSLLRTLAGVLPAAGLAWLFYGFGLFDAGPVVVAFFALLLMMGWAVALGVTALILRHGAGAEALAWGVLFGVTPFAAVFYPVSVLPGPMQFVSLALPAAHVFEGLRAALLEGRTAWEHLAAALALNLAWMAALGRLFLAQFEAARERGALLTIGE
ncbi:MAG: ABC transporter permease [Acetobacteraceae bacterium]|nr:ABC transporter permease [Acetobacteraceae bacterium]MCX7685143.1 ABC transporter permease [Acetobacteraceae bacterium]MDW8398865.1 ABC transporter permease [Acetobacteraceae bacterium]